MDYFDSPEFLLEAHDLDAESMKKLKVVRSIGRLAHVATVHLPSGKTIQLIGAPQRGVEPGARFFAVMNGEDKTESWTEIQSVRFRSDLEHDGTPGRVPKSPELVEVPIPAVDTWTPSGPRYWFSARQLDEGLAGLTLLQVVVDEGSGNASGPTSGRNSHRSVYWIGFEDEGSSVVTQAILLATDAAMHRCPIPWRFARAVDLRRESDDRLATLTLAPPTPIYRSKPENSPTIIPEGRLRRGTLRWWSGGGFEFEMQDDVWTPADQQFVEPKIEADGTLACQRKETEMGTDLFF
jgi:hypothetical protein